jgi:hypothetical protein
MATILVMAGHSLRALSARFDGANLDKQWIFSIQASTPETTTSDSLIPTFFQELPHAFDHCVKALLPSR